LAARARECDDPAMLTLRWDATHWAFFAMVTLATASASLLAFGALCVRT